jgi:hypothetical protein
MLFRNHRVALGRRLGRRGPQAERPGQQGEGTKANDILSFQALAPSPLLTAVESAGLSLNTRSAPVR